MSGVLRNLLHFPRHNFLILSLSLSLLPLPCNTAVGQNLDPQQKAPDPAQTLLGHQGAAVRITVVDAHDAPLARQALVQLHSPQRDTTNWQFTQNSQTLFQDLPFGRYDIQASVVGYLSGRTTLDVASMANTLEVKLTLQPDPSSDLESDAALPPHTLRRINRAIRALNSNDLKGAQKQLEEADKSSPSSAQVSYLFGYLYFFQGDFPQAQTALEKATTINPHSTRALTLLGRVYLVRGENAQAITALQSAVANAPDNWIAHDLLADAYLGQRNFAEARAQAELALAHGDGSATVAQLARGEALANLGERPEAVKALKAFLNAYPKSSAAPHAQAILAGLGQQKSKPGEVSMQQIDELDATPDFNVATDLLTSAKSELPPTSWLPPDVDRSKPPVVAGLACPAQQVIEGAGDRVQALIENVQRIAAVETIDYERLDQAGDLTSSDTRKFDYSATVSQQPNVVLVDEYRSVRYDQSTMPDHIADSGFAELALVFHPNMRDAFKFTCEGLGEWHGEPVWLVRFQQREDLPNHLQAYRLGDVAYPVYQKGRAWITADEFNLVRIESDMIKPMPQIALLAEHMVSEYAPVPFHKTGADFWLPQTADVYLFFRGQRVHHKHSFDKYMLFSVETDEKIHEAKHDPDVPKSTNPKKRKSWPA
jgi:tetratricopeptide (TPR) repeat protein